MPTVHEAGANVRTCRAPVKLARGRRRGVGRRDLHRVLCVLLLAGAPGAAPAEAPPWYDLERVPGEVGAELREAQGRVCSPVILPSLPITLPDDARLVLLACTGGPYPCRGEAPPPAGREPAALGCPSAPPLSRLATLHLVTHRSVERLRGLYARELGARFEATRDAETGAVVFVEKAAVEGQPRLPKHLRIRLSPTKGPFAAAGYAAQVRLTFSARLLYPPVSVVVCYLRAEALEGTDPGAADLLRLRTRLTGRCPPLP